VTFRETVVRGTTARDHTIQLFDTARSRAQAIATFTATGLAAGELVLVVARADAWSDAAAQLKTGSAALEPGLRDKRLTVLDAGQTLSKFTRRGWPDAAMFETVIGDLVRRLATRGRLRVYGDMVDLLAAERDFNAAVALENLWNALARTVAFSLFCGYSANHFGPDTDHAALNLICRCHSATRVDVRDELASWLLESSGSEGAGPFERS